MPAKDTLISVDGVTLAFGDHVVQQNLNFAVQRGDIFVIMGASGCGKSTLLRSMIGLLHPSAGDIRYDGRAFWATKEGERSKIQRHFGVLFQSGALWSSLTLAENVGLPLSLYTPLGSSDIAEIVSLKLSLVGLRGFEDYYPAEISGGMKKRAGLARAIALDPQILFFDEPSAGLDPLSSKRLDELILELRDSLGATVVMVSHELASILSIADDSVFLDADAHTATAHGRPKDLCDRAVDPKVRDFLSRGQQTPTARH